MVGEAPDGSAEHPARANADVTRTRAPRRPPHDRALDLLRRPMRPRCLRSPNVHQLPLSVNNPTLTLQEGKVAQLDQLSTPPDVQFRGKQLLRALAWLRPPTSLNSMCRQAHMPRVTCRDLSTPVALRQEFEHSPITSGATLRRAARHTNFAPAQTFFPHLPRSAGQEGFEHSPMTSTSLSESQRFPWSDVVFICICRPRKMAMFEPLRVDRWARLFTLASEPESRRH